MRILTFEHTIKYFDSKLFREYFDGMRVCVFDIETMGLSPKYQPVVLASILEVDKNDTGFVTQYLVESLDEEPVLLTTLFDELNKYDVIITYNGQSFDIPYILLRAEINGLKDDAGESLKLRGYNFDLLLFLRGYSSLRGVLPNLKQKTIECYMGLNDSRDDEISGAESVEIFKKYFRALDADQKLELSKKILLHNHDDVMQLYKLLPIITQTDFHKALTRLGFPIYGVHGFRDMLVSGISLNDSWLVIKGKHYEDDFSYRAYAESENDLAITFSKDGHFEIRAKVQKLANSRVLNVRQLRLPESDLERFGGYINGFMVLSNGADILTLELNMTVKAILNKIMDDMPR